MRGSAAGAAVSEALTQLAQPTHSTSDAKAFSQRLVATATTALIAYAIICDIDTSLIAGGIEFIVKIGIYYLHDVFG